MDKILEKLLRHINQGDSKKQESPMVNQDDSKKQESPMMNDSQPEITAIEPKLADVSPPSNKIEVAPETKELPKVSDAEKKFADKEPIRILQDIDKKLGKDGELAKLLGDKGELAKRLGLMTEALYKGIGASPDKAPKRGDKQKQELEGEKKGKYIPTMGETIKSSFGTAKKFLTGDVKTIRNALDSAGIIKKGTGKLFSNALERAENKQQYIQNRLDTQGTTFGSKKSFAKSFEKSERVKRDIQQNDERITTLRKAGFKEEQIKRGNFFKKATELQTQLGEVDTRYSESFGGPKKAYGDERNIIKAKQTPKKESTAPRKATKPKKELITPIADTATAPVMAAESAPPVTKSTAPRKATKPKKELITPIADVAESAPPVTKSTAPRKATKPKASKAKSYGDLDNLEMAKVAGFDNVADWYKDVNTKAMSDDPKVAKQAQVDLKAYENNRQQNAKTQPKRKSKKDTIIDSIEEVDDLAPTKKPRKISKERQATNAYWDMISNAVSAKNEEKEKEAEDKVPKRTALLEARAAGGPVNSGKPYLVGEKGPEIIIPASSGNVISNAKATESSGIGPADTTEQENEAIKREEQMIDLLSKIEENTRKEKAPEVKKEEQSGGGLGGLALAGIAALAGAVFGLVKGYIKIIKDVLTKVFESVKGVFEGMGKFFAEKFGKLKEIFGEKLAQVGEFISEQFGKLKKFFNIGEDSKIMKFIEGVKSGIGKLFKPLEEAGSILSRAGESVGKAFEWIKGSVGKVLEFFEGIGSKMGNFGKIFKKVAGIFEKLALPLMVIMAVWDTVKGFMEGFEKDGIVGGIKGALVGLFDSLVGGLLNLIKDGVSWLLNALGFENAAKALDSFDFTKVFADLIDALFKPIMGIVDLIKSSFEKFSNGDIMGGIEDIMKSLGSLLTMPIDLVKNAVSWILDKLGFEDASKFLDSFNFADIAKTITEAIFHPFDTIRNLFNKLVGFFENIEIPGISFDTHIPGIGKVSFGPWHPFKSEQDKSSGGGGSKGADSKGGGAKGGDNSQATAQKPAAGSDDWLKVNQSNIDSWTKAVQSGSQKIENVPPVYRPYVEKALKETKGGAVKTGDSKQTGGDVKATSGDKPQGGAGPKDAGGTPKTAGAAGKSVEPNKDAIAWANDWAEKQPAQLIKAMQTTIDGYAYYKSNKLSLKDAIDKVAGKGGPPAAYLASILYPEIDKSGIGLTMDPAKVPTLASILKVVEGAKQKASTQVTTPAKTETPSKDLKVATEQTAQAGGSGPKDEAATSNTPKVAQDETKQVNDWAYSVYIGKATPEQVPKILWPKVQKVLNNPPSNWKKDQSPKTASSEPSDADVEKATEQLMKQEKDDRTQELENRKKYGSTTSVDPLTGAVVTTANTPANLKPADNSSPNLKPADTPQSGNRITAMSNENADMATSNNNTTPASPTNNVNVVNSNQSTTIVNKPPIRTDDSTANSYLNRLYSYRW